MPDSIGAVYPGGTFSVKCIGAHNEQADAGVFANSLTLTYAIYEYDPIKQLVGDAIASATGSISYQSASDGDYFGSVSKDVALEAESWYWIVISDTTFGVVKEAAFETF